MSLMVGKGEESKKTEKSAEDYDYKKVIESLSELVMITRPDGIISYLSPSCKEVLGYDPKDLVGKAPNIFHKDDQKKVLGTLKGAMEGKSGKMEYRIVTKDRKVKWVSHSWVPVKEGSRFLYIQSLIQDITEKKEADSVVRESEEKFRNIFESVEGFIIYLNTRGKILDVNQNALKSIGKRKEEVVGSHFSKLGIFPLKEIPKILSAFAKNVMGKQFLLESAIKTATGKEIPIECTTSFVKEGEKIIGVLVMVRDVSERKRADEKIMESEKRFRDVAESSSDWIWEINASGKYTLATETVKDIIGYSPDELIGKSPFDFMPPEEADRVRKIFGEAVSRREPIKDLENWNITKDGKRICLLTNGVPMLDEKGNLKGYRGVDKDITDRKKTDEEVMKRTEDLEKFSKLSVGRELRMVELKKRVNELETLLKKHGISSGAKKKNSENDTHSDEKEEEVKE